MLDLREKKTGGAVINNEDITVTTNGTYTAGEGYTGLGTVTVNVPKDFKPDFTGLKTIYSARNSVSGGVATSVVYPSGTKDDLTVSPDRYSNVQPLSNVNGFITDFEFPATVTQIKIEMSFVWLDGSAGAFLVGYGGSSANNRYTCPAVQISSSTKHLTVYFSENGTSWATMTSDTGYTVTTNTVINLSVEYRPNGSNNIECVVEASTGTDPLTQVFSATSTATKLATPLNNLLALFFGASGSTDTYSNTAIKTDINKLKITVNNEVKFDGANA